MFLWVRKQEKVQFPESRSQVGSEKCYILKVSSWSKVPWAKMETTPNMEGRKRHFISQQYFRVWTVPYEAWASAQHRAGRLCECGKDKAFQNDRTLAKDSKMDGEIGRGCTCRETEQKKISAKTLQGETEREKRGERREGKNTASMATLCSCLTNCNDGNVFSYLIFNMDTMKAPQK